MQQSFPVWNGPKEGARVGAPMDAEPGMAVALPWKTPDQEDRFAVYVLQDFNGQLGLLYLKSYEKAHRAQERVQQITRTMILAQRN